MFFKLWFSYISSMTPGTIDKFGHLSIYVHLNDLNCELCKQGNHNKINLH